MSELLERVPPHDREAEKSLLGSVILDPRKLDDVLAIMREPQVFHLCQHQQIFKQLLSMNQAGQALDTVLLAERLRSTGEFENIGGYEYLTELVNHVPSAANAVYYAQCVAEHARRRSLIRAGAEALRLGYDQQHPLDEAIAKVDGLLDGIDTSAGSEPIKAEVAVFEAVEVLNRRVAGKEPPALSTGLRDLDNLLGGLRPGELVIVSARPSMGKTALALNVADHVANGGQHVLFVSLEMSARELVERIISARSGVDGRNIQEGRLRGDERREFDQAAGDILGLPLWIDTPNQAGVFDIASKARRLHRKYKLALIVIDYLGFVTADNPRDPRHEQVGKITRSLKRLARECGVPVMLLCQLNRETEKGGDHRPRLGHLRESGSIEQDADVVLFVHREEYYRPNEPDVRGKAEIIIAKNRNGATGTVEVLWQAGITKFGSIACGWEFAA